MNTLKTRVIERIRKFDEWCCDHTELILYAAIVEIIILTILLLIK